MLETCVGSGKCQSALWTTCDSSTRRSQYKNMRYFLFVRSDVSSFVSFGLSQLQVWKNGSVTQSQQPMFMFLASNVTVACQTR